MRSAPKFAIQVGVFPVKQRLSDEVASKVVAVGVKSVLDRKKWGKPGGKCGF